MAPSAPPTTTARRDVPGGNRSADGWRGASARRRSARAGVLTGGENGPAIVVGDPEHSRLITAVRYGDADLQMPPKHRLSDPQIADLVAWIANGAVWVDADGRVEGVAAVAPPHAGDVA